ncbi:MAG: TlpA disulfide reductase family protein [Candidatus Thiodiazotropha sp.]
MSSTVGAGWLEAVDPAVPAPSLMLRDLAGDSYNLSDFKGKTVLVNFWTTWCPPCIEEMPSLISLNRDMEESEFVILAVNVEENRRRVGNIARRLKLTFPVLLDQRRDAGNAWDVKVFPSSFLVDAKGWLRYRAIGPVVWDSDEVGSTILRLTNE